MHIGAKIKVRREELGMSQEMLALAVGYASQSPISKIESGEISVPSSKVAVFANALKTSVADLMGLSGEDVNLSADVVVEAQPADESDARLEGVHKALSQFIIYASKEGAPSHAVQALPEAVKGLVELTKLINLRF